MAKQSHFLSGFVFDRKDQRARQALIVRIAGVAGFNFLAGCFFLVEPSDIAICLLGSIVCLLLAGFAHFFGALDVAAHSFIALSFFSLAVLTSRTGGINSPGIVWMPTIPIAALLLINLRWSLVWFFILILHNVGQFMAMQYLWISADVSATTMTPVVTLWIKLNIAIALILVLYWYEIRHRDKIARVAARTHDLGELQVSLQQTRTQIDALVSALESQLRVPMQRIRLMAPITQLEVPTASATEDDASAVAQASHQLLNLVDELGDLAKLESGHLVLNQSAFDIPKTLAKAVAGFKARNAGSDVTIQWAADHPTQLWAMGDGTRLSRVVADLLAQSMGNKIGESLQVNAAFDGKQLAIEIPQATSQSFTRPLDSADPAQAKQALQPADIQEQGPHEKSVALAGGRISFERKVDGTVLRLEWPMRAVAEPYRAKQATKGELHQAVRVMLIGSQASLQFEMQQTLRQLFETCEFGLADTAHTALVQLDFGNFDLVLIELQSPGIDALELTRRIRTHAKPHMRELTVIGLGNAMLVPQRQIYLDAGMQWILFRPWTLDTLFRALSAQLR
jgi:signal transduction histidine kinase